MSGSRIAFLGAPHLGGTHSVFLALRRALEPDGIELRWLAARSAGAACDDALGHYLDCGSDAKAQVRALIDEVQAAGHAAVVFNVLSDPVLTAAAQYLPADVKRVMFVHSISRATYAAASAIRANVHHTIAVSQRIRDDLLSRHGFAAAATSCVPNAYLPGFAPPVQRPERAALRALFLGRLDDTSKGVLEIPRILEHVRPDAVTLDIAGVGPDGERLLEDLGRCRVPVRYLGGVPGERVPELLRAYDVLLAPSRFEGFCLSIVEAMASGVVPIASRVAGVTDRAIDDGQDGFLFPIGDRRRPAQLLEMLAEDRSRLRRMGACAAEKARANFSLDVVGPQYRRIVAQVLGTDAPMPAPADVAEFELPAGLRPAAVTHLPEWMKRRLRSLAERMRY